MTMAVTRMMQEDDDKVKTDLLNPSIDDDHDNDKDDKEEKEDDENCCMSLSHPLSQLRLYSWVSQEKKIYKLE